VRKITIAAIAASLALSGCGTFLPMEDESNPGRLAAAETVQVFNMGDSAPPPRITRTLGAVEGHSCKNKLWDTVSREAALRQMKLQAVGLGANGVLEVREQYYGKRDRGNIRHAHGPLDSIPIR
jgi:hypothetical protein